MRLFLLLLILAGCGPTAPPSQVAPPPIVTVEAPSGAEPLVAVEEPPVAESPPGSITDPASATLKAPPEFRVRFVTTEGDFTMRCPRAWAPRGVDRLYNLLRMQFYDDAAFFRVIPGFMAQFGIHANPAVSRHWKDAAIAADPLVESNRRGTVSFAQTGNPDSRTTQLFINLVDNERLDGMGFTPVCEVTAGLEVVDRLYGGYGEGASRQQPRIQSEGNAFLRQSFPDLDYVLRTELSAR